MNWLFRGKLLLKTRLSLLEVYGRLTHIIGKKDSNDELKKKYVGRVYENGFELRKLCWCRWSKRLVWSV